MENKPLVLQCRGTQGDLEKDVGVVIIPHDMHNVDENTCYAKVCCPHYLREEDGICRASQGPNGKKCLFYNL